VSAQQAPEYGPERGSLVIAGGGPLDGTGIIESFIELGGGAEEGRFIIVPTAGGNRDRDGNVRVFDEDAVLRSWRARGLRNVSMLHTHDPEVADSADFVAELAAATAVWFNGGRQWNIVDSYAGTRTYDEFHGVLERRGVIGGSSAGATIQGEYLVRGDTSGSAIVMTEEENHQLGFEFLRRAAIDQHINTRDRWDHIIPVIEAQPELLGIGLSESTAIVVQGDSFEVIGEWMVAVHDNTRDYGQGRKPYLLLSPGDSYDMRTRTPSAPIEEGGLAAGGRSVLEIGDLSRNCLDRPTCMNRIHPAIPMAASVEPGEVVVVQTRNATDFDLDPEAAADPRSGAPEGNSVHPLTGPIEINGARRGDVLKVRILDIQPGLRGMTVITGNGVVSDVTDRMRVDWRLNRRFAVTDNLPGVRIPNGSFPGIVTVLPGPVEHAAMLAREAELREAGGAVSLPAPLYAAPAAVCGEDGSHADECLRTFPPREHGGNLDIRYLGAGVSIYLPCYVDGCGLAIGDLHYAQGDGEVAGTAIEMDAIVTLTTEIIKDGPELARGPHYEGPARLLDIPSGSFYATTGFPLKAKGEVPPHLEYLESPKISGLENLSMDVGLAARNALLEMIDYISTTYGYSREQAFIIASVAVDLRIGQLVDAPNVGVTAILPLDIFEQR